MPSTGNYQGNWIHAINNTIYPACGNYPPEVSYVIKSAKPWLPFVFIPLTYGLRLFSERMGIMLGSLYIGIMALGSIYIGAGTRRDYIIPLFHDFVEYMNNPILFAVITILFCMLIHLSFVNRKSYLE